MVSEVCWCLDSMGEWKRVSIWLYVGLEFIFVDLWVLGCLGFWSYVGICVFFGGGGGTWVLNSVKIFIVI